MQEKHDSVRAHTWEKASTQAASFATLNNAARHEILAMYKLSYPPSSLLKGDASAVNRPTSMRIHFYRLHHTTLH